MGVFGACFGGAFKCNRRVDTFEKRHAFMQEWLKIWPFLDNFRLAPGD